MKFSKVIAVFLCSCAIAYSQDVPNGVRYKKASDEVNRLAKSSLENALINSDAVPTNFFGDAVMVGPMLWKALKPGAGQVLLGAKPVVVVIPGKSSFAAEGKGIVTDDERKAFWKRLRTEYPNLKDAKVRKGNAEEISYFWATIPFDIEEPFWVIEGGGDRFIVNFQMQGKQPRLFWIDLVGDLAKLKP